MDVVVAGTKHFVNMIEVGAREVKEDEIADAIEFGHKAIVEIVGMIEELQKKAGQEKVGDIKQPDAGLVDAIRSQGRQTRFAKSRATRQSTIAPTPSSRCSTTLLKEMAPPVTDPNASYFAIVADKDKEKQIRTSSSKSKSRSLARRSSPASAPMAAASQTSARSSCEVGVLPRVHGSAVFTRGETQAMCTVTLGTSSDEQMVDGLIEEYSQKFMLHYNFPSYSVGEVRPIRGPGRREIGHGALAERA